MHGTLPPDEARLRGAGLEELADRIQPRKAANLLLWMIGGFFVLFLLWAALTDIDRTVRGQGRVLPSQQLQVVSNLEGGIVDRILVRTGQLVKEGAALILLDQTQSGAELGSNQAQVAALDAKIARLQAEVSGTAPNFPSPTDPAASEQVMIERALYASRMNDLASLENAGRARVAQAQRAVAEAQAAYQSRVSARDAARAELELVRPLVEKGIEPRLTLVQLENQASIAATDAAAAAAAVARARAAVAEASSALAQQRADWRSAAATELATAQAELAARRRTMPALADKVRRTTVTAPVAGRVNRVLVTTVGGSVAAGAPLVELVPTEDSLLIEALVNPKDIAFIRMGQEARINITAYDSAIYGSLHGEVIAISPDTVTNERTGETNYTVRVRATDTLKDANGRELEIGPGMTAEVNLLGDERSVLSYILSPITKLSQTALRE